MTCICIAWFIKVKSQADVQMKQSEHLVKKMIKKLEKYKSNPAVLEENFPLYVLLVARMHRWEHTWTPVKRLRGKVYIAASKAKHVRLLGVLLIYKTNHTRVNWTCAHMRTITTFEMLLSLLATLHEKGWSPDFFVTLVNAERVLCSLDLQG